VGDVFANVALAASGSVAISIILKATVLLVLALSGVRLAGRVRASVRHVIMASLFGVLLVLPVAAVLTPPLTVEIARPHVNSPTAGRSVGRDDTPGAGADPARLITDSNDLEDRQPLVSAGTLLATAWASGSILVLWPLVTGFWQLRRVRRCGLPWLEGQLMIQSLGAAAGISRPVKALIHEEANMPMTCGFVHPVIVLPSDVHTWTRCELRQAVIHELEHVRRGDWLVHLVARAVCGLYWFHPLVWTAWRQLDLEAERACDDAVLIGADRTAYAQQLVALAKRLSASRVRPILGMANRTDLSARVAAVLDDTQPRGRTGGLRGVCIAAPVVIFMTALSALRAMPVEMSQLPASDAKSQAFEVVSITRNTSGDRTFAHDAHARVSYQAGGICASWGWIRSTDTCFGAANMTLRELIAFAFGPSGLVPPIPQIFGGPNWIDADRFDVIARATGTVPLESLGPPQSAMMVRTLLTERFKLRLHHESRALPLYELLLARSDRGIGPRLRPATTDCVAKTEALRGPLANAQPVHLPSPRDPCVVQAGGGYVKGGAIDMSHLARTLSNRLNRVVRDQTGLSGMFEIDLTWPLGTVAQAPPGVPQSSPLGPNSLSISTALQEQLGLKLKASTGPVDVLVIDGASPPTPD
jgi:uncharacterized protein (TIGR03435 family)